MPAKKQTKKQSKVVNSKFGGLTTPRKLNLKIATLLIVVLAAVGAYLLFFAEAATNNCQTGDNNVQVCDVNMVVGDTDTVLSINNEAESLGSQKWGMYFNTTFRAQKTTGNGAVPITRVYNEGATLRDWVTDTQKSAKEAKYGAVINNGIVFYAWKTQVKDTVPVYRISRAGNHTQHIFSVDKAWVDKMLAQGANDPNGWKRDIYGPFIAFYAYPPNYKVADKPNPYDCSIQENFLSDRCKDQREALQNAVNSGAIPKGNTCPTTLTAYLAAPFPGQFEKSCQDKWNKYMQDCSIKENFLSDRCKTNRDALEAAYDCSVQANFLSNRCDAERNRLAEAYDCSKKENFLSNRCDDARKAFENAAAAGKTQSPGKGGSGGGTAGSTKLTPEQLAFLNEVHRAQVCQMFGKLYIQGQCVPRPASQTRLWWVTCNYSVSKAGVPNPVAISRPITNHRYQNPNSAIPRCQKWARDNTTTNGTSAKIVKFVGISKRPG